jgi:hypothetical protein
LGHAAPFDEDATLEFACDDDRRHEGEAGAFAGEEAEHGHVVDFRSDDGLDAVLFEEQVEGDTDVAIEAWEHQRGVLEVLRKTESGAFSGGGAHQADGLLVEQTALPRCLGIASNREV